MGGDSRREVRRIARLRLSVIGKVSSPPWEMVTTRPFFTRFGVGAHAIRMAPKKKKKSKKLVRSMDSFLLHTILKKKKFQMD